MRQFKTVFSHKFLNATTKKATVINRVIVGSFVGSGIGALLYFNHKDNCEIKLKKDIESLEKKKDQDIQNQLLIFSKKEKLEDLNDPLSIQKFVKMCIPITIGGVLGQMSVLHPTASVVYVFCLGGYCLYKMYKNEE